MTTRWRHVSGAHPQKVMNESGHVRARPWVNADVAVARFHPVLAAE
jgi:hypothetical protein